MVSEARAIDPRAATLVLGMGTLVSHGFGLSLLPALLPRIESSFDSGFAALGAAVAAGLAAYAIGGLLASRVLDWIPNRTVLNSTFLLTGLALVIGASSNSAAFMAISVIMLGISAPVSWAATTHVAARSVPPEWRSIVMSGAAGGVGLGVIFNGTLVHLYSAADEWRTAFVVASAISLVVMLGSLVLFRAPIDRPSTGVEPATGALAYRRVLSTWPGRVVVLASSIAGVCAYTFNTFLTTTAIGEMGSSATEAGGLFWMMGGVGVAASLLLGGMGSRRSPTLIVGGMFLTCGAGVATAAGLWSYPGLAIGAVGVAILNYPVWGLVAAIASNRFKASDALTAVSMGLVGASVLSAAATVAGGKWIDSVGDVRAPYAVLAVLTLAAGVWLVGNYNKHIAG